MPARPGRRSLGPIVVEWRRCTTETTTEEIKVRKFLVGVCLLAIGFLGTTVVAGAQSTTESPPEPSRERDVTGDAAEAVSVCDGGGQEAVVQNLQNSPQSVREGNFVTIAGGTIPADATVTADTITVTLTGDASMASAASPLDIIEIRLLIDGVVVEPGVMGFHSGVARNSHSVMWCKRLPAGTHTATVQARVFDRAPFANVLGVLDNYVLRVERSE